MPMKRRSETYGYPKLTVCLPIFQINGNINENIARQLGDALRLFDDQFPKTV
jgi:hypothetical protein